MGDISMGFKIKPTNSIVVCFGILKLFKKQKIGSCKYKARKTNITIFNQWGLWTRIMGNSSEHFAANGGYQFFKSILMFPTGKVMYILK